MQEPEHFEMVIASEPSAAVSVQDRILKRMEAHAYSSRDLFAARLALEEALINAIRHGNQLDKLKIVRVRCDIDQQRLRVEVEDEGRGFRPEAVPDPRQDENLDRPSGRGLLLMRSYMNLVEYNSKGNRVTMERHRDAN